MVTSSVVAMNHVIRRLLGASGGAGSSLSGRGFVFTRAAASPLVCSARASPRAYARGFSSSSSAKAGAGAESAAEAADGGGAGMGGFLLLGLVGAVIGFFYRGHRSTKARVALIDALCDERALEPEEVNEIREENGVSVYSFMKSVRELKSRGVDLLSGGASSPESFFSMVAVSLGMEGGAFKSAHLFERLALRLKEAKGDRVDNDLLIVATSLAIDEHDEELARVLFALYADDCTNFPPQKAQVTSSPSFIPSDSFDGAKPGYVFTTRSSGLGYYADEGEGDAGDAPNGTIRPENMHRAVSALISTDQIPVRKRVAEVNEYPLKRWEETKVDDMIKASIKSTKVFDGESGDKPPDAPIRPMSYEEFEKMIFSNSICAWNACYDPSKRRN